VSNDLILIAARKREEKEARVRPRRKTLAFIRFAGHEDITGYRHMDWGVGGEKDTRSSEYQTSAPGGLGKKGKREGGGKVSGLKAGRLRKICYGSRGNKCLAHPGRSQTLEGGGGVTLDKVWGRSSSRSSRKEIKPPNIEHRLR